MILTGVRQAEAWLHRGRPSTVSPSFLGPSLSRGFQGIAADRARSPPHSSRGYFSREDQGRGRGWGRWVDRNAFLMEGTSKHRTKHLDIISMNPCRSMLSGMLWPITGHYFFEGVSPVGGYHRIHLGTRFDRRISFLKAAMFFLPTPFDRDTAQKNSWLWGSRSPDLYYLWTPACSKLGTPAKMGGHGPCLSPQQQIFWSSWRRSQVHQGTATKPRPATEPLRDFSVGRPRLLGGFRTGGVFGSIFWGNLSHEGDGYAPMNEQGFRYRFVRFCKESLVMVAWAGTSS